MPPDAPESLRSSPFYVNMGFVIVPRELLPSLRKSYLGLRPAVAPRLRNPYFAGQVALTLAVHANDLPRHAIDLKYNFPNDPRAETMYPDSLRDIRVIHYLRTGHFDRIEIFASAESFDQFLALDLVGSERIFQDHVRALTNGHYPFR